jgi:hypothetical protein
LGEGKKKPFANPSENLFPNPEILFYRKEGEGVNVFRTLVRASLLKRHKGFLSFETPAGEREQHRDSRNHKGKVCRGSRGAAGLPSFLEETS